MFTIEKLAHVVYGNPFVQFLVAIVGPGVVACNKSAQRPVATQKQEEPVAPRRLAAEMQPCPVCANVCKCQPCACMRVHARACACMCVHVRAFLHESPMPCLQTQVTLRCFCSQETCESRQNVQSAVFTQIHVEKFSFSVQKGAWFQHELGGKQFLDSAKNVRTVMKTMKAQSHSWANGKPFA